MTTPLCRHLQLEVNQWPSAIKLVQTALNRKPRASRGGRSPIELTTTLVPTTRTHTLVSPGMELRQIDKPASEAVDHAVNKVAALLEDHWDLADRSRRVMSARNRKRTATDAMPKVDIGDYVLYAVLKRDTKLDYTWRGPGVITRRLSPLVYGVKPAGMQHAKEMQVHVCRLRRFAAACLGLTEQIRTDLARDHPDNIVAKVVAHGEHDDKVWFRCRWKGFTREADTWQLGSVLVEDCPAVLRAYHKRCESKKGKDPLLTTFMKDNFPSLEAETLALRLDDELSESEGSQSTDDETAEVDTGENAVTTIGNERGNTTAERDDVGVSSPAHSHRYPTRASRAR